MLNSLSEYQKTEFHKLISSCTLYQKKCLLLSLKESIKKESTTVNSNNPSIDFNEHVEVIEDFVQPQLLDSGIIAEVESMGLNLKSNKPQTQWLSFDNRDYCFSDNQKLKHPPKNFTDFPTICNLMSSVNAHSSTTKDANAALVIVYNSEKAAINFHDDGESLLDGNSSISTVTIGATREVQFCNKKSWPRLPQHTVKCGHHDLMVMHPGCQEMLVHRVCQGNQKTKAPTSLDLENGCRIVISFRKVKSPSDNDISLENEQKSGQHMAPSPPIKRHRKLCIIAGDSHSMGLNEGKLGRKGRKVVKNLSQRGARIPDVQNQLGEFLSSGNLEEEGTVVDKVFLCVGTNDIRDMRDNETRGLKSQLLYLVEHVKLIFPDASVWVQSLVPLPWQNKYTFSNVENFNCVIYEVCKQTQSFYLDIFKDFLIYNPRCNGYRRHEVFFVNHENIHLNTKYGLKKLARRYIEVIHSTFNPLGY